MSLPTSYEGLLSKAEAIDEAISKIPRLKLLGVCSIILLLLAVIINWSSNGIFVNIDSAVFQHGSWYAVNGGRPYVDFWLVKPPMVYQILIPAAIVSSGNMLVLHILSVSITILLVIGTSLIIYLIIKHVTQDEDAAFWGGISLIGFHTYLFLATTGFRPKYAVAFFGLLSILLSYRDRWMMSGVSSVVALGFWQLAVIFPAITVVWSFWRSARDWSNLIFLYQSAGATIGLILVFVPTLSISGVTPIVAEVILSHLLESEPITLYDTVISFLRVGLSTRFASFILLIGSLGTLYGVLKQRQKYGLILILGAWFGLMLILIDFDAGPDIIPGYSIAAIGTGFAVHFVHPHKKRILKIAIALIVIFSLLSGLTIDTSNPTKNTVQELNGPYSQYGDKNLRMSYIYWNKTKPDECNFRMERGLKSGDPRTAIVDSWQILQQYFRTDVYRNCPEVREVD